MNTQTKTTPTHTPTPWAAYDDGQRITIENGVVEIAEITTENADNRECALVDAAFIVKAVNTHEELVAALEIAMQELEANKVAMLGPEWASQRTMTGGALIICVRALAKAKGTT